MMRICLICTEFFGWGASGGFGYATRVLGRELVKRGIDVCAAVPQPRGTDETSLTIDGVRIYGFPRLSFLKSADIYRSCDADIYHSMEPSLGTYIAMKAMPERKHLASLQDPRTTRDWLIEFRHSTLSKLKLISTFFYYENYFTRWAIRHADLVCCPAKFLIPKSRKKFHLDIDPVFMPTPTFIPENVTKAETPTVCFVGRWDRRKRPELFFDLAKTFPTVNFVAVGKSQDQKYENELRHKYKNLSNLEMTGFINQFEVDCLSKIYGRSWILANTAAREGLPNTFFEACGHRCAILSSSDPDGFASQFGRLVTNEDFAGGLEFLLKDQCWKEQGQRGYEYVKQNYDISAATNYQIEQYSNLLLK